MSKIIKRILLLALVFLVLSFVVSDHNNSPKEIIRKVFKGSHTNPEILRYRIYAFSIVPMGEAVFHKVETQEFNGQSVYHISIDAKTFNIIALFFKAAVSLDSYVDRVTSDPILFKQKISIEGKPDQEKEVSYDQKQGFMTLSGVKRQIFPHTQDPLSLMFNLRKADFAMHKDFDVAINTNNKNYILKGAIVPMQFPLGSVIYNVYRGNADIRRREKDNPYHRSGITIWFVKERENIPILINVFASGILAKIRLVEAK